MFKVLLALLVSDGTLSENHAKFIESRLAKENIPSTLDEIIVLFRQVSLEYVGNKPKKSFNIFDWFRKTFNVAPR